MVVNPLTLSPVNSMVLWLCSNMTSQFSPSRDHSPSLPSLPWILSWPWGLFWPKESDRSDGVSVASLRRPCMLPLCLMDSYCPHESKPGLTSWKMKNHMVQDRVIAAEAILDWQVSASWPADHRCMNKPS